METYLLTKKDLFIVIDNAKKNMTNLNLPLYVSNKEIEHKEVPSLAIVESVLMLLNSKKLLTKQISLDYTNPCGNFEIEEE